MDEAIHSLILGSLPSLHLLLPDIHSFHAAKATTNHGVIARSQA